MTDGSRKPDASRGEAAAKVRTAGETPAAGRQPGQRPVRPGTPSRRPVRPRPGGAGAGARLLAPVALVICAIAVFSVLTSGGSGDGSSGSATKSSKTSKKGDSAADRSSTKGEPTSQGGAATEPVRATYRVKPGDTFSAIAEKTGVDVDKLAELNPDVDPRALQTGQKLKLK